MTSLSDPSSTPAPTPPEEPFKVTSAADILSYVLHTLGFQPVESLVLLTMCGKRVGATLRVDLPVNDLDPDGYAAGVCSILTSDVTADGVLLILYTREPLTPAGALPRRNLVRSLTRSLDGAGLQLRDGWLVTDTMWRDYFCDDPTCCPASGHPIESVLNSQLNAELIFRGSSFATSLDAAVETDLPAAWTDPVELAQLCEREQVKLGHCWTAPHQFSATLRLWDCLLGRTASMVPITDGDVAAHLIASLVSRPIRDAVLVLAALGWETSVNGSEGNSVRRPDQGAVHLPAAGRTLLGLGPDEQLPLGSTKPAPWQARDFCEVLTGEYRGQLRWKQVDAAHRLLSRLSAVAVGEPRAAALTMLGWIEWARGRGSRAHVYLGEALEEMPGYSLAELLEEVVGRGMLAEWSRDKDLAWRNGVSHAA